MVVDDAERFLMILQEELTTRGFSILTASNGKKALEVLQSTQVDVVVTDFKMPEMNGMELIDEMRKNQLNMPVIVMSAYLEPGQESAFIKLGASGFIPKPLTVGGLLDLIRGTYRNP